MHVGLRFKPSHNPLITLIQYGGSESKLHAHARGDRPRPANVGTAYAHGDCRYLRSLPMPANENTGSMKHLLQHSEHTLATCEIVETYACNICV
jgi:hypothetical protein